MSPSPSLPDPRRRPRVHTAGAPPLPPIRPDPRHTASCTRSQPSSVVRVSGWASHSSPEWLRWTPATPLHLLPHPNARFGFPLATGCSLVGCIGLGLLFSTSFGAPQSVFLVSTSPFYPAAGTYSSRYPDHGELHRPPLPPLHVLFVRHCHVVHLFVRHCHATRGYNWEGICMLLM